MDSKVANGAAAPAIDERAAEHDEVLTDLARDLEGCIDAVADVRERIGLFAGGREIDDILTCLNGTERGMVRLLGRIEAAR